MLLTTSLYYFIFYEYNSLDDLDEEDIEEIICIFIETKRSDQKQEIEDNIPKLYFGQSLCACCTYFEFNVNEQ
jgi:hypothetical protein